MDNPRKISQWFDLHQNQPHDIQYLLSEIDDTHTHLSILEKWTSENVSQLHRDLTTSSIYSIQNNLSYIRPQCAKFPKQLSKLQFRIFPSLLQIHLETIETKFSAILTDLSSLAGTLTSITNSAGFVVVRNMVPVKPHNVHFNFEKMPMGLLRTVRENCTIK